ncbi:MAG: hypothetical protein K2X94_00965 [Amoebophilaceae bacterium]|nr:hypothetical protein [Amoebophilaceae bacterium]
MLGASPPATSITALSPPEATPVTQPAATTPSATVTNQAPVPAPSIPLCRISHAAAHPLALPTKATLHFKEVRNNYVADLQGDRYTLENIPVYFEGTEVPTRSLTPTSSFTPQSLIASTPVWQKTHIHLYPSPLLKKEQSPLTPAQPPQKASFIYIGNPLKHTHFTTTTGESIQFVCTCSRAGLEAIVYKQPKGGTGETSETTRLPVCFTEGATLAKLSIAPAHYLIEVNSIKGQVVSPFAECGSAQEFLGEMQPSTAAYIMCT